MNDISDFKINDRGWLVGYSGTDKDVTVPDCVVGLDNWAFSSNDSIETITVPESVKSVSYKSIVGLDNLKKIVFAEGVEKISNIAVSLCPKLECVSIPDSILELDKEWVYECPDIKYTYDGAVKYIGNENNPYVILVDGDKALTEYDVKPGTKIILDEAFMDAENLKRASFPEGLKVIAFSAFSGCESLAEVSFGEGLSEIGGCAFSGTVIEELKLPGTLRKIGWRAFEAPVKRFSIPEGIQSVGDNALGYGDREYNEYEGGYYLGCEENPYVLLVGTKDKDIKTFTIHKDTRIIGAAAFKGQSKLREIILPEGIVNIEKEAFFQCYGLEKVSFPESLAAIGDSAFMNCCSLSSLDLPEGRISIGSNAFSDCTALEKITLVNVSVGDNAFGDCRCVSTLTVGEKCNIWGDYVFAGCFRMKKAILPERMRDRFSSDMFEECDEVEIEYV